MRQYAETPAIANGRDAIFTSNSRLLDGRLGLMPEQTPYDADRSSYSREALARLVLCDEAAGIARAGTALVSTRNDADNGFGGRVSEAAVLVGLAQKLLVSAVIYERERGAAWGEIGGHLDMDPADAEARFGPDIERWHAAFDQPYRLDETGQKRIPQLPTAAYDPRAIGRQLDVWASIHVLGHRDPHEVTECLDSGSSAHRPGDAPSPIHENLA